MRLIISIPFDDEDSLRDALHSLELDLFDEIEYWANTTIEGSSNSDSDTYDLYLTDDDFSVGRAMNND